MISKDVKLLLLSYIILTTGMLVPAAAAPTRYAQDQSFNRAIHAVPVTTAVTLDGVLDEWDLTGGILACADVTRSLNRYAARFDLMYDTEALYLAARITDLTPMINDFNPHFDQLICHRGDTVLLRLRNNQRVTNFFCYWWSSEQKPAIVMAEGEKWSSVGKYDDGLARGCSAVFRKDTDNKGYVAEIRIPWSVYISDGTVPQAGDSLEASVGTYWGGRLSRSHHEFSFFDLISPEQTRGYPGYWLPGKGWGKIHLSPEGNLALPTPPWLTQVPTEPEDTGPQGTIPVTLTIPAQAKRFTIAINDAQGQRVRNLAGDFDPVTHTLALKGDQRTVQVMWDGLDDRGQVVQPGPYQVTGLSHEGLGALYRMQFYNPGTPPWQTTDGRGAWMADHAAADFCATAGENMILSSHNAEGGHGIIAVGPDGRKRWGEKRGAQALTADAEYVYFILSHWYDATGVCRLSSADGSFQPLQRDGESHFPLKLKLLLGDRDPGPTTALAIHQKHLAMAFTGGLLAILDVTTGYLIRQTTVAGLQGLAYHPDGTLHGIVKGRVATIDPVTGVCRYLPLNGLGQATALTFDPQGRLVVADMGPDRQVKVFDAEGLVIASAGRLGGRPIRGDFDKQGMRQVHSVANDMRGHYWTVEDWDFPRRIAVWGQDGQLAMQYIGGTNYGGGGAYMHDQDPTLAYVGPVEMKLNYAARTWEVSRVLWVPDPNQGESFTIAPKSLGTATRFTRTVHGQTREYLFYHAVHNPIPNVVLLERDGRWQPVAAVCWVGHISGQIDHWGTVIEEPSGEFAGLHVHDGCYWNDTNRDGKVQRSECEIIPTQTKRAKLGERGTGDLSIRSGWGTRIGDDFSIYADGLVRHRPIGMTEDGAPRYGSQGTERINVPVRGDIIPVGAEKLLVVCNAHRDGPAAQSFAGIDDVTGAVRWTYPNPYHSVHGSHKAGLPQPGLIIGPLKITGVAWVNEHVGRVFHVRGNMGEDYLLTTDGLFVGAMFKDCRVPYDPMPATEAALFDQPVEHYSHGGEAFNGWFGRHRDGKVRMTCSLEAREAALVTEVTGLNTIRRAEPGTITLDASTRMQARQAKTARQVKTHQAKTYSVQRVTGAKKIDGHSQDWRGRPALDISRPGSPRLGKAWLAYDDESLYVFYDIQDAAPMRNQGRDPTRLFKTGAAADLQLNINPALTEDTRRQEVAASDVRIVLSLLDDKPVAVLMKPIDPNAPENLGVHYRSPVLDKRFARVEVLTDALVAIRRLGKCYQLEARLPLVDLGLTPESGRKFRGDIGFISADAQGVRNTARTYWANPETNIINDLPHESWLYPDRWGTFFFE